MGTKTTGTSGITLSAMHLNLHSNWEKGTQHAEIIKKLSSPEPSSKFGTR